MEPVIGRIYVVAGRGEMKLTRIVNKDTLVLLSHGNGLYWASPESLVREATQADLDARAEQAWPRNIDCQDPECWCHPVIRPRAPQTPIGHGILNACTCGHRVTVHIDGACRLCPCTEFKETP